MGFPQPGRVDVAARIVRLESVVGLVVQPAVTQRRARVVALGGVVEHDVEQHLEPGGVQGVDHGLELGDLPARVSGPHCGGVAGVRGEVADGVVAPVVGQAAIREKGLGHALVHREQLDRGHAEMSRWAMAASWPSPAS